MDVTEKQREKDKLQKLSLVASKTDNSVLITDAKGRTEWVNEGFTKLTGYTLAEVAGIEPTLLLRGPETDELALKSIAEILVSGGQVNVELINYRKTGEKFCASVDITPILDDAGTITQFIAIQKDITFKKE